MRTLPRIANADEYPKNPQVKGSEKGDDVLRADNCHHHDKEGYAYGSDQ